MPPRPLLLARRRTAVAAALALPLVVAGCGAAEQAQRRTVEAELQSASAFLLDSRALSVQMAFTDPAGSARRALTSAEGAAPEALADVLLGGSISWTIDPAGERTMRDLQDMPEDTPAAEVFAAMDLSVAVAADGGPIAQLRLVDGDLYAAADLGRIGSIAGKAGGPEAADSVDDLAQQAPPGVAPLLEDVRAGEWVRLPLAPYAKTIDELGASEAPAPEGLEDDLLAAVKPFVQVTDAGGEGGERVLDVQVQAKKAVEALISAVQRTALAPQLDDVPADALSGMTDGTVEGQVRLQDGHLTSVVLDLASAARLSTQTVPDLFGSTLTVTVDDTADEVVAPEPVSDIDVAELVEGLMGGAGAGADLDT